MTLREQFKELIDELSESKQEELTSFLAYALSNSRIMLLEDLHNEGYITQSVGFKYMDKEAAYIQAINKNKEHDEQHTE